MSTQAWIFLVGLRVFDLGGMIIWLVWFFRRSGGTDGHEDEGGGGGGGGMRPPDGPKPGGPGLDLPIADSAPWPTRLRDHGSSRRPAPAPRVAPPRRQPLRSSNGRIPPLAAGSRLVAGPGGALGPTQCCYRRGRPLASKRA